MAIQFFRNRSAKLHVDIRRCSSPLFVPAALALTCCKAEKITSLAKEMKGGLCSSNAKAKLWRIKVQEAVKASQQKLVEVSGKKAGDRLRRQHLDCQPGNIMIVEKYNFRTDNYGDKNPHILLGGV